MELYEVMRTTPSVRAFIDEPVPDGVLHRMLDHARFAPSGGNRQGWRVIVMRDEAKRLALGDLYRLGWREYMAHLDAGLVPFAPIDDGRWVRPAVDLDAARQIERPHDFADHVEEAPVLLVLCVELRALAVMDNGLSRQSIVGGGSIYPFAHNLLLAARNEGLGGVLTTVLCRGEVAAKQLLAIPPGFAIAGMMAIGRPTQEIRRLRRRAVEKFSSVDAFDGEPFTV